MPFWEVNLTSLNTDLTSLFIIFGLCLTRATKLESWWQKLENLERGMQHLKATTAIVAIYLHVCIVLLSLRTCILR